MSVTISRGQQSGDVNVNVTVEPADVNVNVESGAGTKKLLKKGNLTADGSEQTLVEATGLGIVEGYLDMGYMQSGDTIIIKQYVKVEDGGSYKICETKSYSGIQSEPILHFLAKFCDLGVKVTLQQTAGVYRAFPNAFYKED